MEQNNLETNIPLRFHYFIWCFGLPVTCIRTIVAAVIQSLELEYLNVFVVMDYLINIVVLILGTVAFIGFFKWRKFALYTIIALYIFNLLSNIYVAIIYAIYLPEQLSTMIIPLLVTLVFAIIVPIYYIKRQSLFHTSSHTKNEAFDNGVKQSLQNDEIVSENTSKVLKIFKWDRWNKGIIALIIVMVFLVGMNAYQFINHSNEKNSYLETIADLKDRVSVRNRTLVEVREDQKSLLELSGFISSNIYNQEPVYINDSSLLLAYTTYDIGKIYEVNLKSIFNTSSTINIVTDNDNAAVTFSKDSFYSEIPLTIKLNRRGLTRVSIFQEADYTKLVKNDNGIVTLPLNKSMTLYILIGD